MGPQSYIWSIVDCIVVMRRVTIVTVMRRVTIVTINVCVCWDQVPCSVGVLAFWTDMFLPYYFYPCGSSHLLFSKIQYQIIPSSSLSVKPTVIYLLPRFICPMSQHLTCCTSSTVIVWHHILLNSASTHHSPCSRAIIPCCLTHSLVLFPIALHTGTFSQCGSFFCNRRGASGFLWNSKYLLPSVISDPRRYVAYL